MLYTVHSTVICIEKKTLLNSTMGKNVDFTEKCTSDIICKSPLKQISRGQDN